MSHAALYFLFSLVYLPLINFSFFFFNDTATTEIYTLSLHDALPIWISATMSIGTVLDLQQVGAHHVRQIAGLGQLRSEEHTSELQSHLNLVCRLLLEKKKNSSAS